MGWNHLNVRVPKNRDALFAWAKQEFGFTEGSQSCEVVDFALRGQVGYMACKRTDGQETSVEASVVLLSWKDGNLSYNRYHEAAMPYYFDCPKRILDSLTPTEYDTALKWRASVREFLTSKHSRIADYNRKRKQQGNQKVEMRWAEPADPLAIGGIE